MIDRFINITPERFEAYKQAEQELADLKENYKTEHTLAVDRYERIEQLQRELADLKESYNREVDVHTEVQQELLDLKAEHEELNELLKELLKENDTPLLDRGNLVSILQKLKQKVQPDPTKE